MKRNIWKSLLSFVLIFALLGAMAPAFPVEAEAAESTRPKYLRLRPPLYHPRF